MKPPSEGTPLEQLDFIHHSRPGRVVFGAGSLRHLEREVLALGAERALVLCTPGQRAGAEAVAARLGARSAGVFAGAVMHVPMEVAREAQALARTLRADCAVAPEGSRHRRCVAYAGRRRRAWAG